jgi:hypothetical protein
MEERGEIRGTAEDIGSGHRERHDGLQGPLKTGTAEDGRGSSPSRPGKRSLGPSAKSSALKKELMVDG